MNIPLQALILIILILISLTITGIDIQLREEEIREKTEATVPFSSPNLSYERASLLNPNDFQIKRAPSRKWEILDPEIKAKVVLIQSLDENFPFLSYNTYQTWPMASLTKLLTALVVLEDIGENKKIVIDEKVVATEGEAGGLRSGEVFTARDLLKIMLLTSSNDAAAAFENYLGKEKFVRLMNQKARALGMSQTVIFDGSGLSDLNKTSASDLLRLGKYILENEPEIFNWSRVKSQLIQPLNDFQSRTVLNINNLVDEPYFLGGKTGTSDRAGENLFAIVSFKNTRLIAVILGSPDRKKELENLLEWIDQAYIF